MSEQNDKKQCEKLEYAVTLIEGVNSKEKSPMSIVESALTIMEFGGITPKQMLYYLEAVGR